MAQSSGPVAQGTTAERQFTDVLWRDLFGDEPGVIADMDGTAYALSLPSGSDIVSVGSTTQASVARLAGFAHRIPTNSPETITIPAASGGSRTDIIALRYDPAFTGAPGPVRLTRIAGTSTLLPAYDAAPPGVEDLPLWAITRAVGQNLSQATVQRLYPRIGPTLDLPAGAPLPLSSPLGTIAMQGTARYRRQLNNGGAPEWAPIDPLANASDTGWLPLPLTAGWSVGTTSRYRVRDGVFWFTIIATRGSWPVDTVLFNVPNVAYRPAWTITATGIWAGVAKEVSVRTNGEARMSGVSGNTGIVVSGSWPLGS